VLGSEAKEDLVLVRQTRALVPLLVQDAAALGIIACVRAAARLGGAMAEAGVFAGGTARLICAAKGAATLHLFDVFDAFQTDGDATARSGRDTELRRRFGTVPPLAPVEYLLASFSAVRFHPGVFPESARGLEAERFSFVHVDLDLEPSTRDALAFFHPRLVPGGILLGDDYQDQGVRRAFDAYFAGRPEVVIGLPWGQAMVVKRV
jgi:hypothetical protein